MAATYGKKIPFGPGVILPLAGFPKGRARIRVRSDDFTKVYIKTENGIRGFYPEESNGVWIPCVEF